MGCPPREEEGGEYLDEELRHLKKNPALWSSLVQSVTQTADGRKWSQPYLRYYLSTRLENLRKTTKGSNQEKWSLG